jgi:hypothetical protein
MAPARHVFFAYLRQLRGREARCDADQRRPQPTMYESDLAVKQTTNKDVL